MQAKIQVNEEWISCELYSPHNTPPIKNILPGGVETWVQVYSQFNAKLEFPFPGIPLSQGSYQVIIGNDKAEFIFGRPEGSQIYWGNLLM